MTLIHRATLHRAYEWNSTNSAGLHCVHVDIINDNLYNL